MIKILIADASALIRKGFQGLLGDVEDFNFIAEASNCTELKAMIVDYQPTVVILDFQNIELQINDFKLLKRQFKSINFLAITNFLGKAETNKALDTGVTSYLLKECDREELIEAIRKTHVGERFICGKILDELLDKQEVLTKTPYIRAVNCKGINVTDREIDIIRCITEGLSNKQIADQLFLSTHTVNTHRKNIMNKLGVNNTAGVVMYAVKNNLLERNNFLFS